MVNVMARTVFVARSRFPRPLRSKPINEIIKIHRIIQLI